jgi:hypothetical protein
LSFRNSEGVPWIDATVNERNATALNVDVAVEQIRLPYCLVYIFGVELPSEYIDALLNEEFYGEIPGEYVGFTGRRLIKTELVARLEHPLSF